MISEYVERSNYKERISDKAFLKKFRNTYIESIKAMHFCWNLSYDTVINMEQLSLVVKS